MAGKKKFLVPHDGDKVSDKGLRYAYELAKSMDAEVILLRVIPEITYPALLATAEREEIRRSAREETRKLMDKEHSKLSRKAEGLQKKGIKASAKVVQGEPAEMIIQVTKKLKPYMVIMGGRRLEGIGKVKKLGSVTRKVAEDIGCGIFIVR